jgi:2-iminobutanoate/2-iminopropanoate deaminase
VLVAGAYNSMMKMNSIDSPSAPQPAGGYTQALEVVGAQRLLFVSGQIPETAAGEVPTDFPAQARLAWKNVLAQLAAAEMSVANLVKVTVFLASREFAMPNRVIRQEVLGPHRPALTVIITGIFDEKWLLEIEAMAAA